MIKIFDANDTNFNTNGNIVIKPLKLLEVKKKSLNGWYIEVEIPIKYKEYIKQDKLCVIKTKSKLKPQAFRISNPEYGQRKISFTANHVMFDSKDYFLEDVRPTNLNGLNTLKYINERTDKTSPFTILSSDVETIDTCYFIRKNLFEAWEVIEERYGGVFDADNFDISFKTAIGVDRGEIIAYGKNLQNIKIYEDWSNVCTKLYPVGKDGLLLESKYITSDIQYDKPYTKTVSFESELDEEEQTEENLLNELLVKATNYLQENKYPQVSYEITSDINQLVEIGDKIHVKHPLANILTEVLEYEFNVITKKVKKLVFGNYVRDVKTKFDSIKNSIEKVVNELSGQAKIINEQTDLINSLNKNGYVYIDDNEILILDELPKENAKNVWRFGLGGIGFSSTGYQGPFSIAMTADGKINADFISTGTLAANRIEGYDDLLLTVDKIANLEREVSNKNYIYIENAMMGQLEYLEINGPFSLLYPSDDLFPSNDLYLLDSYLIIDKTKELSNDAIKIHLPLSYLKDNEKFIIENGKTRIEKLDGKIEELEDIDIQLFEGDNYIYLESFQDDNIQLNAKYIIKNDYTDKLVTKVEMNNSITQSNERTDIELSKKVGNDEIIAKINMSTEKSEDGSYIGIQADKLDFKGKEFNLTGEEITIKSKNFNVDSNGIMKCKGATLENINIEVADSSGNIINFNDLGLNIKDSDGNIITLLNSNDLYLTSSDNYRAFINPYYLIFSNTKESGNRIKLDNTDGSIKCISLTQTSLEEKKKNIELLTNAKEILNSTDIYKYNFKDEKDDAKPHIGFVIGNNYNYSKEITSKDNDGAELYSMLSVLWQVVKEQQVEIDKLKEE